MSAHLTRLSTTPFGGLLQKRCRRVVQAGKITGVTSDLPCSAESASLLFARHDPLAAEAV